MEKEALTIGKRGRFLRLPKRCSADTEQADMNVDMEQIDIELDHTQQVDLGQTSNKAATGIEQAEADTPDRQADRAFRSVCSECLRHKPI